MQKREIYHFYGKKEKNIALEDMGINMPEQAKERLAQPSEQMKVVLMARLAEMSPEELQALDKAITPDVMNVIMKLLPELGALIQQVMENPEQDMPQEEMPRQAMEQDEMPQEDMAMAEERMPEDDMGALANMT